MTIPYTYRVYSKSENKFYYGVRFAKNCNPNDLFVTYFTSSKGVKKLIEKYGKEDFRIEIRKVFNDRDSAINWERRVNRWTMKWPNYLNKHSNGNFILSDEERKEIGIKAGNKCRDMKLGFHSLSKEDRRIIGRKAAETNKNNKTGIYSITKEEAHATGIKCFELRLGFHSTESRKKQKESAKKPWWNNGERDIKSNECPGEQWKQVRMTKGKKWWNNGIRSIMTIIPPDNTWKEGRINWRK